MNFQKKLITLFIFTIFSFGLISNLNTHNDQIFAKGKKDTISVPKEKVEKAPKRDKKEKPSWKDDNRHDNRPTDIPPTIDELPVQYMFLLGLFSLILVGFIISKNRKKNK
jgi:hypothetical protein